MNEMTENGGSPAEPIPSGTAPESALPAAPETTAPPEENPVPAAAEPAEEQSAAVQEEVPAAVMPDLQQADRDLFRLLYPELSPELLADTPSFRRFCGSRLGREPLVSLYEAYSAFTADLVAAERARSGSRRERATGSGTGGTAPALSPAQQQELERWNADNPRLRMSAREFLQYSGRA